MESVLYLAGVVAAGWACYALKEQVKRKVLFKTQYNKQQARTLRDLLITTSAAVAEIRRSLAAHLLPDEGARATFLEAH